jgi:threonyl-tRNA synthetase
VWNELMDKYKKELALKEPKAIKVTLPDGKEMSGESWRTTPLNIAEQIRY